mgnify:FL=1|jgi:hypothetical protein|tara:strand:- start:25 stop:705 length:681 start_codon:yes stop_codon:yes gene_type:complete
MAYTLTNIQDDIKSYTEVDDTVFTTAILNTIIKNAENRIYREVDSDDNRFYATSNLQSGSRYVTIPSDLRSIRYVQLTDTTVTPNVQTFLEKKETSYMATFYDTPSTAQGLPKYYANWDANFWVVAPTPNANYEITLAYVKQPDTITSGTPSTAGTYLSNKYQDLLLYAALVEAYGYLKGPVDMLQYYEMSYKRALASYSIEQEGRRRRDEYQDGVIRNTIKSPSP